MVKMLSFSSCSSVGDVRENRGIERVAAGEGCIDDDDGDASWTKQDVKVERFHIADAKNTNRHDNGARYLLVFIPLASMATLAAAFLLPH